MAEGFDAIREKYLPLVDKALADFLDEKKDFSAEMAAYHLETGGKRLRALIPLYVFDKFGRDPIDAIPLGAAVEMIHNATLVHDDLQDGDEVRRNRATVWKKYSPAQAINCGDSMFQYAFRLLARLKVGPDKVLRLMDRSAQATLHVIEGQVQEFLMKDEAWPNVDRYVSVVRGKTSGLFALPVVGAMEALGLSAEQCEAAEAASMDLGMLFQIQDDLLDIYGKKGRDRSATDIAEGKISILVAHVYEHAAPTDKAELREILRKSRDQTTDADIARALAIFERSDAKGAAIAQIRRIQKQIAANPELRFLAELGDLFLEPVHGIL